MKKTICKEYENMSELEFKTLICKLQHAMRFSSPVFKMVVDLVEASETVGLLNDASIGVSLPPINIPEQLKTSLW